MFTDASRLSFLTWPIVPRSRWGLDMLLKTQLQTACRGQQKPTKYYAVADGYDRGVYNNWSDAKAATNGYSNNCHQSFRSPQEASQFVQQGGAYSKQDWAQSQGGQSSNGYKPK
ncbi:hypothetical protein A4X06_0g5403 [Tilletia controversa]|uniref:Ribonuclease H1 N-terminal domain-containing protein n=3 Tax=Tilletia TaxID=13289 RepID=A0A8X7MS32_9BASI|nr:hypothetical protein A4X06_0g5403 [Tilletia controversa]